MSRTETRARIGQTLRRLCATTGIIVATCAACSVAGATGSEQDTTLAPICAEREVQVITLLEDHALAQDVASDKLGEAGLARLDAQMTCYQGRVAEAVSIYDRIIVELGTVIARSVR
jgi:hypothetical protein